MKKIAFLFLTRENPNFPKIWNSYFRNHKDKYTIYIHPKNKELLTWHKKDMIINLKETGWGFITRAYLELMKEAYKDDCNYKFITISESCIPIQKFDQFYEDVVNDSRSWIKSMNISQYNMKERIVKQNDENKPKNIIKNYARFCLNREHVKLLLSKENELEFFHKMHVGDEFFLSVLYPLKNIRNFAVTYDDWDYVNKKKTEIKEKKRLLWKLQEKTGKNTSKNRNILEIEFQNIAKNPKTIIDVKEDLEKIKNCKSYFYRKFAVNSNIEKYWKEIINYHSK